MGIRNTHTRWGYIAQFLHWLIVALIILQTILASIAEDLPISPKREQVYGLHKSVGITVLALALVRLIWRWANLTPALPSTLKAYERSVAHLTHVGLYVLLFAQPISGWLMTSAQGLQVSWFGFFQLPDLVHRNSGLFETLKSTHDNLALALYLIVFLHVAAALKHHFVSKDDVLRRMLPFTEDRDR